MRICDYLYDQYVFGATKEDDGESGYETEIESDSNGDDKDDLPQASNKCARTRTAMRVHLFHDMFGTPLSYWRR